jgi:hypothetical protein
VTRTDRHTMPETLAAVVDKRDQLVETYRTRKRACVGGDLEPREGEKGPPEGRVEDAQHGRVCVRMRGTVI